MTPFERFSAGWQRFWFSEASAVRLSVCRVLFFGGLLYTHRYIESWQWGDVSSVFWFPTSFFSGLGLSVPGIPALQALTLVYKTALAFACVGFLTQPAMITAFGLAVYLLALPQNFGKVHHSDAVLIFVLAALALSRAGDHGSVDAWLRRKLRPNAAPPPSVSGEYQWPIRFAWVACVIVYFSAGVAKLRMSGLDWTTASAFRNLLLKHHYTHEPKIMLGLSIAEIPWLCSLIAKGTILGELSAPLSLVHRRLRSVVIPMLMSMQLGIFLLMGVTFRPFILLLTFWIPWDSLLAKLRRT